MAITLGASGASSSVGVGPDGSGPGLLRSAVRRDIVDTLTHLPGEQRDEGLTAQELGDRVGLHVTTIRFHLDRLLQAGLVDSHSVRSPGAGRPSKRYSATRTARGSAGDRTPAEDSWTALATLLAEGLVTRGDDGEPPTPEQIGAAWAHTHAAELTEHAETTRPTTTPGAWSDTVALTLDVLRAWGYTSSARTDDAARTADVDIIGCPFLELARERPEVVCEVHRGLVRGTLEVLGEPDVEVGLTPFAEPTRCTSRIAPRIPVTPRGGTS